MKSSHGTVPHGLSLYSFDYPAGHLSEATFPGGEYGACVPNPPQCHLEGDAEAIKFGREFGATHATHAVSGRVIEI